MSRAEEHLGPRTDGLRANSLAAVVMLVIELGLGAGVNPYVTLPAADHGKALFPGFGAAVTAGPVILAVHAVLGTLLVITAVVAVIRACLIRRPALIVVTGVGLLGIVVAWLSGARFVGTMANSDSVTMAVATAVSVLCYVIVVFITPAGRSTNRSTV